jgi:ABC-type antimicrobial peptide transport system permease subunit
MNCWRSTLTKRCRNVKTMEEIIQDSVGQRRTILVLLGSFAGIALLLATVGIYGVIAYTVAQRTGEMAIRRALGAQARNILRLVLGQGLGLALCGVSIGVPTCPIHSIWMSRCCIFSMRSSIGSRLSSR